MPPSSISRGPITNRLLEELATEGFPVGDNASPPPPFGWQGEPNDPGFTFTPWMSLSPGAATLQPSQAMGDSQTEWKLSYSVVYAGISRKQTEALADRVRLNLTDIARESVETPTGNWKIQKIGCTAIGNTNRVGSAYPDYFTQADSFEVWVTKGSSSMSRSREVKITKDGEEGFVMEESVAAYERRGWTRADDGSSEKDQNTAPQGGKAREHVEGEGESKPATKAKK